MASQVQGTSAWINGQRIDVAPGETLLLAALRQGIDFPNRCRVGGCGTCRCRLAEGEVRERTETAYLLSEDEIRRGFILACQSVPAGDVSVEVALGAAAPRELAALYTQIASFNAADRHSLTGRFDARSAAELGAMGFPILFLCGADDILFPVEAVRMVQAEVAGSFLVEVNDAGHSAFLEQPVQFNDTILSLLQMAGHVGTGGAVHSNTAGYVRVGGEG